MQNNKRYQSFTSKQSGFSLFELLAVVSIMGILGAITVGSMRSTGARQLETAGTQVAQLVEMAKQTALSRNAMVAFVAVPGDTTRFALFELRSSNSTTAPTASDWNQISKWEILPQGVFLNTDTLEPGTTTFSYGPPQPSFKGNAISASDFSYLVYMPSGALLNSTPVTFNLSETRGSTESNPTNIFALTVIPTTGRVIIDRS